jgi:hypothetical protein
MADDGSGGDITIPAFLLFKEDADTLKDVLVNQNGLVQVKMTWDTPAPDDRVEWEFWHSPTEETTKVRGRWMWSGCELPIICNLTTVLHPPTPNPHLPPSPHSTSNRFLKLIRKLSALTLFSPLTLPFGRGLSASATTSAMASALTAGGTALMIPTAQVPSTGLTLSLRGEGGQKGWQHHDNSLLTRARSFDQMYNHVRFASPPLHSLRRICIWNTHGTDGVGQKWWRYIKEFGETCDDVKYPERVSLLHLATTTLLISALTLSRFGPVRCHVVPFPPGLLLRHQRHEKGGD